jgi:hypothetical protein
MNMAAARTLETGAKTASVNHDPKILYNETYLKSYAMFGFLSFPFAVCSEPYGAPNKMLHPPAHTSL